jgi:hypothetical protein
VPRSYSEKATAAIDRAMHGRPSAHEPDGALAPRGVLAPGMLGPGVLGPGVLGPASVSRRRTPVFIVASPRPQVGKTFIARLLVDFLRLQGDDPLAFDLNPGGDALRDYLPGLAVASDVEDIHGQMALFDRLIVHDGTPKVVDVGSASFERFFTIAQQIRFIEGAQRRSIDPMILFAADPHPVAVKAYADLQRRFPSAIVVAVFDDAIVKGRKLRDKFPFTRTAAVPLQIAALSPLLKAQVEQPSCSFVDVHDQLPIEIPVGLGYELRAWTRRTFLEFRELELRLLLEQLRASLENPLLGD